MELAEVLDKAPMLQHIFQIRLGGNACYVLEDRLSSFNATVYMSLNPLSMGT